ncbi:MAG: sulfatase [Myxococcota bacterium]
MAQHPNIVLLVVDTLRADHLGAYGYGHPTSPNIDRLAQRGVVFTRARATSSWTKPSVASLFTSRRPSEHQAVSFDRGLRADLPTLAELLRDAGYRTMGVSANFVHVNSTTGLSRGFDIWETITLNPDHTSDDTLLIFRMNRDDEKAVKLRAATAPEVNRVVLDLLPPAEGPPLFLYVHYMDPHAGYMPPEPYRSAFLDEGDAGKGMSSDTIVDLTKRSARLSPTDLRRMVALYDAEIATTDAAIGSLLAALEQRGFGDDVVTVVLSDHGEEFGEHGGWFHGLTLHREALSIPLVIHDSRVSGARSRRTDLVNLLDVPTTLLALAGVGKAPGMRGRDLLDPGPLPARDIVAELHPDPLFEDHLHPRSQALSVTRWPWKVIVGMDGEERLLYRLDRDPLENEPIDHAVEAAEALLQAAAELTRTRPTPGPGTSVDPDTLDELRALGYAD